VGKKQHAVLAKMKPKFIDQATKKGHDDKKLEKIWTDWEAFASYAFNKSHSTCYAWIAYQTAYLKAHYPAEYMAAVLSNNMNDIKQVTFFMEECKRSGIEVLGPDVNESYLKFSVNKSGAIRFGMGAVKGVGTNAVKAIIAERKENGNYKSIFDLARRVDLRSANKKAFDSLVLAGGFDSFDDSHRAQYYVLDEKGNPFLEKILRYGNRYQEAENSSQVSLFGDSTSEEMPQPLLPICDTWGTMELLAKEKEVVGIYLSAHPLDDFKNELRFCNTDLSKLKEDPKKMMGRKLTFGGILTEVEHRVSKMGKGWASFTLEDYSDQYEFRIFGNEYMQFRHFLVQNSFLCVNLTFQKGWINKEGVEGDPRIKFTNFSLLHDVLDEKLEKLTILLNLDEITDESSLGLQQILAPFEGGKLSLNFTIRDFKDKLEITMPSRGMKLKPTNELLAALEEHQVDFKLN
jgi:DNA polymerase-3 subunit alpha